MSVYFSLNNESVVNYVEQLGLFDEGETLTGAEIGDGNLNYVFKVHNGKGKSVIVKQALPYARIVGEDMPLTVDRSRIEAEAMKTEAKFCPDLVPVIYHVDHDMSLIVMEDLSDHVIMRTGLINRNKYPLFSEHISEFMAKTLFYTSDLFMDQLEKKEEVKKFINPELCKISEDLIFTSPYYDAPDNVIPEGLQSFIESEIWNDEELKIEAAKLKYHFMTRAEALLHGDLHTGSVFVTEKSTKVIDPEFAYYGPMGFDIGAVIANLLLNYAAQEGRASTEEEKEDFRNYLLETVKETWNLFVEKYLHLVANESRDLMFKQPNFQQVLIDHIFADTIGFAGCKMIRRIHGLAMLLILIKSRIRKNV
ncbi:MAG: S-methyl-5-thioribose kinase [Bacillus sp. (in: Bacteria)]|nr:S-methyl-5-thioribose kinase [Bacillus sp. (in: firmicutes)]